MSVQENKSRRFACPKCGQRYEPPYLDDIHRIARFTPPSDPSTCIEGVYECLNCHHAIKLYWLEGNQSHGPRPEIAVKVAEALQRHRERLNNKVFIPLGHLRPHQVQAEQVAVRKNWQWFIYDWQFALIEIHSPYFEDGLKHVRIDIPTFDERFARLEAKAREYREQVEALKESTFQDLKDRVSTIALKSDDEILLEPIMERIDEYWMDIHNSMTLDDYVEEETRPIKANYVDGKVYLDEQQVAALPRENYKPFVDIIYAIARDRRIPRVITDLAGEELDGDDEAFGLFRELDQKIVHPIEDEQYDTIAECCERVIEAAERSANGGNRH